MIFGIGNDIVEIVRIKKIYDRFGNHFARKVLTESEFKIFIKKTAPIHFLAKRFAAKEAFSKALGIGFRKPVSFHGIEVRNNDLGRPSFHFNDEIMIYLKLQKIDSCHLSLSDERKLASAFVILELSDEV
jgi:holo-[acyl-carrier protein] synthase